MIEHKFGGDWTEVKLAALREYLATYRGIFTKNEKAKYFKTWYVDAFAGTGSRTVASEVAGGLYSDDAESITEASAYLQGSVRIALGLESPFDSYLFVEKSAPRVEELKDMILRNHPNLVPRCVIEQGDCNTVVARWIADRDWKKERAVVFLDPYGMQVDWATIELLGKTKAIDLWYLFSFGVVRMMTRDGKIESTWQNRLDRLFGSEDWRDHFYRTRVVTNLFGEEERITRDATAQNVLKYIEGRLATSFVAVSPSLVLKNSKSSPLFALCFAASNERGAPTALKIASSILSAK